MTDFMGVYFYRIGDFSFLILNRKRVCQNSLFERITPATAICGRGKSL